MPFLYMRRHQRALLWIIVIVIVPTFCLLGAYYGRGRQGGTAGSVMGRRIPRWQFNDAYLRWARTDSLFRRGPDLDEQQHWNRYRIVVAADLWGIRVPDEKVVEHVRQTFAGPGNFDIDQVKNILRRQGRGLTLDDYEQTTREMLMQASLLSCIAAAAKVTEDEAKHMYRFEEAMVTFSLVRFEAKAFQKDVKVDAGEVRYYFSRHRQDYRVPEKFSFEYVAAKLKDLEGEIEITDEQARKYYEDNKQLYLSPAGAHQRNPDGENDNNDNDTYRPFEDVREDIESVLSKENVVAAAAARMRQVEQAIDDLSRTQSRKTIDLKNLADDLGLTYATTSPLTTAQIDYHEDLGAQRDQIDYLCRQVAVRDISIGIMGYTSHFVARVLEKSPSYVPEFSDVEDQVRTDLLHTKATEKALDAAINFAQLAGETSFQDVVSKRKLKAERHGPFKRADASWKTPGATEDLVTRIFATPVGAITGALQCRSDSVVAEVTGRREPDWSKFEEQEEELVLRYRQTKTRAVIPQWLQSVKATFVPPKSNGAP